jgi:hypothetical protein
MGTIRYDQRREFRVKMRNSLKADLEVGPMRSPCVCLLIEGEPEELKAGAESEFKMTLDGESYRGEFNKFMHIRLKSKNAGKDVFLPIKFTILGEDGEPLPVAKPEPEGPIKFVDYKGGGFEGHPNAKAWIFAGKACPGCNFLKRDLLPRLLAKNGIEKAEAVFVDLDVKENFIFMSDLEERLGSKGDKTPILYWNGKFTYGNDAVKALIGTE